MYTSPVGYYRLNASAPRSATRAGYPRRRRSKKILSGVFVFAKSATASVIVSRSSSASASHLESGTTGPVFTPTALTTVSRLESGSRAPVFTAAALATVSHLVSGGRAPVFTATATAGVAYPVSAPAAPVVYVRAFENAALARTGSDTLVVSAQAASVVGWPQGASDTMIVTGSSSSVRARPGVAPRGLVVGAAAATSVAYRPHSGYGTAILGASARAIQTHTRSARLNLVFSTPNLRAGRAPLVFASARMVFRAGARFAAPFRERGTNYLGRFQVGQDVSLRLQGVLVSGGDRIVPTTVPEARIYRDGVFQRSVLMPADFTDPGDPGLFRARYTLGPTDQAGRYVVVYLYEISARQRSAIDIFEVVPGGDAAGPVIATYSLSRPDGDVVLAHLGAGQLAAAQGPYIDEGV